MMLAAWRMGSARSGLYGPVSYTHLDVYKRQVLGHPLLAPALGRPWLQAELLALAPDPSAIATLGFLLLSLIHI